VRSNSVRLSAQAAYRIATRMHNNGRMLSSSFVASFVVSFVDITATIPVILQTRIPLRASSGSGRGCGQASTRLATKNGSREDPLGLARGCAFRTVPV
jgi:hypothetical protein